MHEVSTSQVERPDASSASSHAGSSLLKLHTFDQRDSPEKPSTASSFDANFARLMSELQKNKASDAGSQGMGGRQGFDDAQFLLQTIPIGRDALRTPVAVNVVDSPLGGPTRFDPASGTIYINVLPEVGSHEPPEQTAARVALHFVHEAQLAKNVHAEAAQEPRSLGKAAYVDLRTREKAEALATTFDAKQQLEQVQQNQKGGSGIAVEGLSWDLGPLETRYREVVSKDGPEAGIQLLRTSLETGELRTPLGETYGQHFASNWREMSVNPADSDTRIVIEDQETYMATRGSTPRNNQKQNAQFKDAIRGAERDLGRRLTEQERREVHDEITGEGMDYHQIRETAGDLFREGE